MMASALMVSALSGCAVGPDYRRPEVPSTPAYTAETLPEETAAAPDVEAGGTAQRFVLGQDIPEQWWNLFRSEALTALIRQALAESPTYAAAQAALRQAQEIRRAQIGALFPAVDATASASRIRFSGASIGQTGSDTFSLFNASVNVSYSLDLFGGVRRELEALQAQVDYQRFQVEGVYLALTSNIVTTVVKEAALRAQLLATRDILAVQEMQLEAIETRLRLGGASSSDVLTQRTELAQTRATLPPLEKELAQTRHLLAVLMGRYPHEAAELPAFDFDSIQLPQDLPVSLPSALASAASGHTRGGRAAARGECTDRCGDGKPLSAAHTDRQLWNAGGFDRQSLPQWHFRLQPGGRFVAAPFPRRSAECPAPRRSCRLRSGRGPVSRHRPAGIPERG